MLTIYFLKPHSTPAQSLMTSEGDEDIDFKEGKCDTNHDR